MKFNPILTDDFSFNYIRIPKRFTMKGFNKFDDIQKQLLCERYDIILVDYKTKGEKVKNVLGKFTVTNINLGVSKFNKGMTQFTKMIEPEKQPGTRKAKRVKEIVYREPKTKDPEYNFYSSEKDYNKTVKDLLG